jgi:16S rRNA (cytidine1402-2'-O)-methyltransferase
LLLQGKNIALVSDAGTQGISDPGNELIAYLRVASDELQIIPIPGASAVAAALSVCGFKAGSFVFAGYFPKKKYKKWIEKYFSLGETLCYLDTRYRVIANLEKLREVLGKREVCVCRELTKIHEEIYRGNIDEVLEKLKNSDPRGELVVVVSIPK